MSGFGNRCISGLRWSLGGTAYFLVYPRDELHSNGFYAAIPFPFRHPSSLIDYYDLLGQGIFYNIAKLEVTSNSIKIVEDNIYQLSGNQFFYKRIYDEEKERFVLADKIVYSWMGSPHGDCGFTPSTLGGGYYVNQNSGTGLGYLDAGTTFRNLMRAIYSEGVPFKIFSSISYPNLANSFISGFSIKDIEYLDSEEVTRTLTIYLVAFTFMLGTNRWDTEIHIYDSGWNELKSIKLFDWSSYLYKHLVHPVRFNHDSTECVMLNFFSVAEFNEKAETAICTLEYEVNEDGDLSITENITRETVSIRQEVTPMPDPVVTTTYETTETYSISTTTTVGDGVSISTTAQYPVAVNYNDRNERVFAYYSCIGTTSEAINKTVVTKAEIPGPRRIYSRNTGTYSIDSSSVARFIFFDDDIILNNNSQIATEHEYYEEGSHEHQYGSGSNSNSKQEAKLFYIDVALQFLILCETSSVKSPCSPSISHVRDYGYGDPGTESLSFTGVEYEIQSSGTYSIYQAGRKPRTIASYSDIETHNASATNSGETREVTFSYTMECGSTRASDSISYTRTADNPLDDGTNLTTYGAYMDFSAGYAYVYEG